jgi:hypothetical protein
LFAFLALKPASIGSPIMTVLRSFGIRLQTEADYLRTPPIIDTTSSRSLPKLPRKDTILSTSGREVLKNLIRLYKDNQA